jgi:BirA family biotin operon repressor/biotin-[acetyl-CoA-carboxylase] ligase
MVGDPLLAAPTAERLAARLATRWLGRAYEWRDSCSSTSDVAAARAREGAPAGLVIAAETQTAGRGRLGRTWHSRAGESLTFSIVLRSGRSAAEIPPITLLVGAAVAEAVSALGLRPRLKWPNDVQLADDSSEPSDGFRTSRDGLGRAKPDLPRREVGRRRKLAGILTEMASAGERTEHVIVGVGLNVNALEFPTEIAERATSLRRALGRSVDRAEMLSGVLGALEPRLEDFEARGAAAAVDAFAAFAPLPELCRVGLPGRPGEVIEGTALGVDPDGALRVQDAAGHVHRIVSGELL